MKVQAIKDVEGYVKDMETGAVLSTDQSALLAYKKKKAYQNTVINDINNIKDELKELKDMIKLIINKKDIF